MDYESVDQYVESFEGRTREYLMAIRKIMHEVVPGTEELINYNIAAFTLVPGGKRDAQIMMAGYKNHVGFYPHPTTMEHFWENLDGYKKAKGSVQFSLNKPLPEKLIKEMVEYRRKMLY